ncbi:MAG: putative membrane protein [Pirellulaceae bacterium]|jgi:uncharacterized membrane protein
MLPVRIRQVLPIRFNQQVVLSAIKVLFNVFWGRRCFVLFWVCIIGSALLGLHY